MTEIHIKNFQSIGDVSLKVDGFTVIVGRNNIGKSAIVRAIQAALTNQTGKEFIRKGKKSTEVKFIRDGLNVEWKKGTSATYTVNGESFSKLNRAIPDPILDAGYRKMQVGDLKLDPLVANQFSPLYLLDKTGSVITEALSTLYRLDIISKADDMCQKELRSAKSLMKTRESDLSELEKQLEPYEEFKTLKKEIDSLQQLERKCDNLKQNIQDIDNFIQEKETLEKNINNLEKVSKHKIPDVVDYETSIKEIGLLDQWCHEVRMLAESIKKFKNINITSSLESLVSDSEKLEGECSGYQEISDFSEQFDPLLKYAKQSKKELSDTIEQLKNLQEQWDKLEICPLCERPL